MYMIGATLTEPMSAADVSASGKGFGLGDRYVSHDGKEYVYVQASGAIAGDGYVAGIDEDYQATALTTSGGGALGDLVGVAGAAFADNDYGWLQVKGPCNVQVSASAAANTALVATSTAGQLDDAATGKSVSGIVLTAARAASAGTAPGVLNYPAVGATV